VGLYRLTMKKVKCNFCSSGQYEECRIDYLYTYRGNYLLVPNTPVEICLDCGMIYYDAKVLKKIEQTFFCDSKKEREAG